MFILVEKIKDFFYSKFMVFPTIKRKILNTFFTNLKLFIVENASRVVSEDSKF